MFEKKKMSTKVPFPENLKLPTFGLAWPAQKGTVGVTQLLSTGKSALRLEVTLNCVFLLTLWLHGWDGH